MGTHKGCALRIVLPTSARIPQCSRDRAPSLTLPSCRGRRGVRGRREASENGGRCRLGVAACLLLLAVLRENEEQPTDQAEVLGEVSELHTAPLRRLLLPEGVPDERR